MSTPITDDAIEILGDGIVCVDAEVSRQLERDRARLIGALNHAVAIGERGDTAIAATLDSWRSLLSRMGPK